MREESDVRFGSKADICSAPTHVRFTPNSDRKSGLPQELMSALPPKADMQCTRPCLLWAKSGHCPRGCVSTQLFDDFVSDREHTRRNRQFPNAFAVFRLSTSSNFVDWLTGTSAGFSPLRIRPV